MEFSKLSAKNYECLCFAAPLKSFHTLLKQISQSNLRSNSYSLLELY